MIPGIKIAGLVLLLSCFLSIEAYACFCEGPDLATESFNSYDEVFIGKILSIKRLETIKKSDTGSEVIYAGTATIFEVVKKWKGSSKKTITIYQDGSNCSYPFMIDWYNYVVTARIGKLKHPSFQVDLREVCLVTSSCQLNTPVFNQEESQMIIQKLNQFFPNEIKLRSKSRMLFVGAIGVIFLFSLPIIFFYKRQS